jgi:hypothetical protein
MSRYRATYRKDEINLTINFAKSGNSLAFVGVAGVGKSNIINFLRDIRSNAPQIKQDVEGMHFPVVDATQWENTPDSLWEMMAEALKQSTRGLSSLSEEGKIAPISDGEDALRNLQAHLQWICPELRHQVMFILDDFDTVLETGPLAMLEHLNGLRSEGNRGFLSYLIFTKRLPHILGQRYNIKDKSKFYDLFSPNIYALKLYSRDDAIRMLAHLNEVAGSPLSDTDLDQIYHLAGGHARLLKIVFEIWSQEGVSGIKVKYFADKSDVQHECRRILINLHEHEQEVASLVVQGLHNIEHEDVIDHLVRRGMLVKLEPMTWFSPLMSQFLSTYNKEEP